MKTCYRCGEIKELASFTRDKRLKLGVNNLCKVCRMKERKAWAEANPEKHKSAQDRYRLSDEGRSKQREVHRRWREENPELVKENLRKYWGSGKGRPEYQKKYRQLLKECSEFDLFVLEEAKALSKLRAKTTGIKWSIDHIVPISKGGTHEYKNIQVVPLRWNQGKYNKEGSRFLE